MRLHGWQQRKKDKESDTTLEMLNTERVAKFTALMALLTGDGSAKQISDAICEYATAALAYEEQKVKDTGTADSEGVTRRGRDIAALQILKEAPSRSMSLTALVNTLETAHKSTNPNIRIFTTSAIAGELRMLAKTASEHKTYIATQKQQKQ